MRKFIQDIRCVWCGKHREGWSKHLKRAYINPMCYHCGSTMFEDKEVFQARRAREQQPVAA